MRTTYIKTGAHGAPYWDVSCVLDVKAEVHHVAVLHDIGFTF